MYQYKATIRLSSGSMQEVFVHADTFFSAKAMLVARYGKECIILGPFRV
jgi:hypothetical protein